MCGIIGFQGRVATEDMARGLARIARRGPDGHGLVFDSASGTGLGHVRLAILDLSDAGRQPMFDASGNVAIVFNGEIFNYRELRRDLQGHGHEFRRETDTEVLLEMFLRHGIDMLPMLDGMFAFAIFDRRTGELWIARDSMGIKPLYVSAGSHGVAFCSELKGMLPMLPRNRAIDRLAAARYMTYLYSPGDRTPVEGIVRLPPGHCCYVRGSRVLREWRWAADPRFGVGEFVKIEECMDSIRSLTRQSVHSQLISDVPVGAFLSGGVDSSAVVAFARERSPGIRCFTIDSGGAVESGQRDDLPFARGVARSLGVALDEVPVRESEFIESLWSMPEMFDEPIADPAALNTWFISRAARAAGVKVLLSGTGADDLFSGYRRHSILRLEALRRILPPSVRSGFGRMIAAIGSGASVPRRIGKYLNCEESGDFALIAQLMEWTPSRAVAGILSDDGTGSIAGQIAAPLIEHLATTDSNDDLRLALSLDQRFFLGDHNLLYADRLSMAEGVEIRVPLLSDRLVHVSWRVPSKWMVRGREAKWAFRKALRGHVPDLALDRRKSGFGLPLRRWTRSMLRGPLADVLFCTSAKQRGLLRADRVQDVWQSTMEGRLDGAYLLLSMALFELWCVRFIDVGGQESSDASATKLGFSVSGWPARTQS